MSFSKAATLARLEDLEYLIQFIRQSNVPADIAALEAAVALLQTQVATNTTDIAELEVDVTALEASIVGQAAAIASNTANIVVNTNAIAINTSDIGIINLQYASPGSIINSNTALLQSAYWKLFAAGSYTITAPVSPRLAVPYEFTQVSGDLTSSPVTLAAGGAYTITDPQDTLATPASSVTFRTNGVTYRFRFDGSVFRCTN
jgi:hypothetical protein